VPKIPRFLAAAIKRHGWKAEHHNGIIELSGGFPLLVPEGVSLLGSDNHPAFHNADTVLLEKRKIHRRKSVHPAKSQVSESAPGKSSTLHKGTNGRP
jgi:hypothetical protein